MVFEDGSCGHRQDISCLWPTRPGLPGARRSRTGLCSHGPAVEAGERLGFLPGDMKEKVDPCLSQLYDALYDVLPPERGSNEP